MTIALDRIADRKARDKEARRAQIIRAARQIAGREGWASVTVRRLSEEISYSQPVLYSHFESREAILAAVAIEGFQELGLALERARTKAKHGNELEAVATAYLRFAETSSALYEVMFSLGLSVPFGETATPAELRFGFAQLLELFPETGAQREVVTEMFWATLHGMAELTRSKRFPRSRQNERLRLLVELFAFSN